MVVWVEIVGIFLGFEGICVGSVVWVGFIFVFVLVGIFGRCGFSGWCFGCGFWRIVGVGG